MNTILLTSFPHLQSKLFFTTRDLEELGIVRIRRKDKFGKNTLGPGLVSMAQINRWIKAGLFPLKCEKTTQQSKCTWPAAEIFDWIDCRNTGRKYIQKPRQRRELKVV
jgi:hypothetical protein